MEEQNSNAVALPHPHQLVHLLAHDISLKFSWLNWAPYWYFYIKQIAVSSTKHFIRRKKTIISEYLLFSFNTMNEPKRRSSIERFLVTFSLQWEMFHLQNRLKGETLQSLSWHKVVHLKPSECFFTNRLSMILNQHHRGKVTSKRNIQLNLFCSHHSYLKWWPQF